jgi:glycosyltransferase involved in cell wall biosynthesis
MMPEIPHFSVIVPTLHEERTIGETLSSIDNARQMSRHGVEIIVVDGGSNDRTVNIARKHADMIAFPDKRGIGRARNFGAKYAKGGILTFLDADVRVPENFFDFLHEQFTMNNLAGANCRVMPHSDANPSGFEKIFYTLWHNARRFFYNIKPCGTGDNGIIVSREVFEKVNGFDETLDAIEDLDFVFRASKHGKFAYLRHLTIHETIRRFRDMGTPQFIRIYLSNFFHYLLFRNSKVKKWDPVR